MKHYKETYAPIDELYKEAVDHIVKGEKLTHAIDILNTLLQNDPHSFVLTFQLGNCYMKQKMYPLSEVFYLRALQLSPDFLECHMNLGCIYKEMQDIESARKHFKIAMDLFNETDRSNEEKSSYVHNYASVFTASGTPKEALKLIEQSLALDPNNQDSYWNRGLAYLELGDYERGFADYEKGKRINETKNRNYTRDITPFWDGTPGKMVSIYGEQGIGDELMFASMIPDIMKDCKVVLDLHPRLANLFRYNYPNVPIFGTRKMANPVWAKYYDIDNKLSIASLGKFYRKKLADFPGTPFLKSPPEMVDKYRKRLDAMGPKKKIGISWKGGSMSTNMDQRKIKLKQLLPLLELENEVDFISLQYHEDSPIHIESLKANFGKTIHHWQDVLDDYDETAGLVSALDYIISVPQSVVHLAGALGVQTLQLCPKKALWQMGPYGENMPWYSCVENVWQDDSCTWEPVIQQAKEKLCNLLQTSI